MALQKKIAQLLSAVSVSDADLLMITQSDVAKKATFGLLKEYISSDFTHPRDIQLRKSDGYVQWRYVGDGYWTNLINLADLQGPPGTGGVTQVTIIADGVKKIYSGISGMYSTHALNYNVTVGGVTQQPVVSFTVSLNDGGSLIFDEAPPSGLPIDIIIFS